LGGHESDAMNSGSNEIRLAGVGNAEKRQLDRTAFSDWLRAGLRWSSYHVHVEQASVATQANGEADQRRTIDHPFRWILSAV
jgi:hypothetical protein